MGKQPTTIAVSATWDDKAGVWVATSDDVPGLITEAESVDQMVTKLKVLIPELIEANSELDSGEIPFTLLCTCTALAHSNHAR